MLYEVITDSYTLHKDVAAGRIDLPFSATWEGSLLAQNATALVLEWTPGDTASLTVDGTRAEGDGGRAEVAISDARRQNLLVTYDAAKVEKARLV